MNRLVNAVWKGRESNQSQWDQHIYRRSTFHQQPLDIFEDHLFVNLRVLHHLEEKPDSYEHTVLNFCIPHSQMINRWTVTRRRAHTVGRVLVRHWRL